MSRRALIALIGGAGGVLGLALLTFLTKVFNSEESYTLSVVFSIVVFAIVGSSIGVALYVGIPEKRQAFGRIIVVVAISAIAGGMLFPLGIFGYWLSMLPLAILAPLALHGLSSLALKSVLASAVGLFCGGIAATAWILVLSLTGQSYLDGPLISSWVPFGIFCYGLTLGLVIE